MATLNLSLPDDLKEYIKSKAEEMNSSVSEIFVDYIKQIKNSPEEKTDKMHLSSEQKTRLSIAEKLAGKIKVEDSEDIEDIKLNHLLEKHFRDE